MMYIIITGLVFINASFIRVLAIWFHIDFFYAALISIASVDSILIALIYIDKLKDQKYRPYLLGLTLFMLNQTGIVILFHH